MFVVKHVSLKLKVVSFAKQRHHFGVRDKVRGPIVGTSNSTNISNRWIALEPSHAIRNCKHVNVHFKFPNWFLANEVFEGQSEDQIGLPICAEYQTQEVNI